MESRAVLFLQILAVTSSWFLHVAANVTPCDNPVEYYVPLNIQASCGDNSATVSWTQELGVNQVVLYYNCSIPQSGPFTAGTETTGRKFKRETIQETINNLKAGSVCIFSLCYGVDINFDNGNGNNLPYPNKATCTIGPLIESSTVELFTTTVHEESLLAPTSTVLMTSLTDNSIILATPPIESALDLSHSSTPLTLVPTSSSSLSPSASQSSTASPDTGLSVELLYTIIGSVALLFLVFISVSIVSLMLSVFAVKRRHKIQPAAIPEVPVSDKEEFMIYSEMPWDMMGSIHTLVETPNVILEDYVKSDPIQKISASDSLTSDYITTTDSIIYKAQQQSCVLEESITTEMQDELKNETDLHSDDDDDTASLSLNTESTARKHYYGSAESLDSYINFSEITNTPHTK